MATVSHIDQLIEDLLPYGPEKIILFGSAGRGDADEYSDIDLIIVKETYVRFVERLLEADSHLSSSIRVDLFVYTPKELASMIEEDNPFIERALHEEKVIYEKAP